MIARRIVCAAVLHPTGELICSARHFDPLMRQQIERSALDWSAVEQGFIDQRGQFLTREAAYAVAIAARQILRPCGHGEEEHRLYSEHLY